MAGRQKRQFAYLRILCQQRVIRVSQLRTAHLPTAKKAVGRCFAGKRALSQNDRSSRKRSEDQYPKKVRYQVIRETKDSYPGVSLVKCCCLLGVSRPAYYQHFWEAEAISFEQEIVLSEVRKLRAIHPIIGGKKLYVLLYSFLLEHQIKMVEMLFLTCLLLIIC
ncbi:hypothetical protein [Mucilaginibacter xinganensis]|uniref:hypothetical protein n=1 Tax=Mucilaginibacter xinganensis TaxID=1234841 RepID=UPI0012FE2227|nr:hypothetical protein [Mucilaginibacter xinganensis]